MTSVSFNAPKADILIVDDTLNNIHLLATILSEAGYSVRKAINGPMALMAASSAVPDLMLLDINMPGMNGYEVCQQLKQNAQTAEVPVIFLSALDDASDKIKAFQAGGVDYITKPFNCEEVLARIHHQLTIRQLQAQLKVRNEELETTLNQLRIMQSQLIQEQKMLGLGQLIAGIAHEINNPISFIYGNLNPARRYFTELSQVLNLYRQQYPNPGPEIVTAIDEIDLDFLITDFENLMNSMKTGVDRIHALVLALQIFSHLGESEIKAIDLHQSLDSVVLLLQHRLKRQGQYPEIQVIRDYGDVPPVTCHAKLLNQVFFNVLINAVEAIERLEADSAAMCDRPSHQLQPTIWIRTQQTEVQEVMISIRDNGIGMSEEIQARIYEPFFTTKSVGQGSGLGLSTSYQIVVEKHHGQLICDSSPAQGTELIIKLPLRTSFSAESLNSPKSRYATPEQLLKRQTSA